MTFNKSSISTREHPQNIHFLSRAGTGSKLVPADVRGTFESESTHLLRHINIYRGIHIQRNKIECMSPINRYMKISGCCGYQNAVMQYTPMFEWVSTPNKKWVPSGYFNK